MEPGFAALTSPGVAPRDCTHPVWDPERAVVAEPGLETVAEPGLETVADPGLETVADPGLEMGVDVAPPAKVAPGLGTLADGYGGTAVALRKRVAADLQTGRILGDR